MKILIATKNPGKAREIMSYIKDWGFEAVSLADLPAQAGFPNAPDVEETGKTFEENAVLKAKKYFEWSGIPSVADDSGLEIDFLNGEPGVMSRRWPGYEATDNELINIALEKLKGVPIEKRTAHLTAVGAFYDGKNLITERSAIDGYIVEEQFVECEPGYPFRSIFMIPEFGKLYQELTHEEHEKINHRKILYGKLAKSIIELEK